MSRKVSTRVRQLLMDPLTKSQILVKLGPFYDATYKLETTDFTDITFNGELYSSISTLMSLDTPTITGGIEKSAYNLQFIDDEYWFRNKFIHGVVGTRAEIRSVFIDVAGYFNKDQPLLDPEDTMVIYKGTISGYGYTLSKDSVPLANIELASPLGALALVRSVLTSQGWMRQRYPEDNSYDHIFEGSQKIVLQWGKE